MPSAKNQSLTCDGNTYVTTAADVVKCVIIIIIMLLIILGNVCCLVVFNSPKTKKNFTKRVRYMMNSLCCTDLCIGLLMCPSTIYPAITHCWPFGEFFCKVEALLISALFHESTLNMVLIAIDRYCTVHYQGYRLFMTSRRFIIAIISTWVCVFMTYAIVIFVGEQFYFDEIGINCEPFYKNPAVTKSVLSIFYFLPAVIFVFCYGSIYRTATRRKVLSISSDDKQGRMINSNIRTSKYLAAITIGFFCAISPWTLCTLIIVTADITLQKDLDFTITWLALSNSFWNCLIYGVMNRKFRRAAARFACGKWVRSLKESFATRSYEDSKDYTDDFSEHDPRKKRRNSSYRISKTKQKDQNQLEMTSRTMATPTGSPIVTPCISQNASPMVTRIVSKTDNIDHVVIEADQL